MAPQSYVMTVSGNGQVSIPAEIRARWQPKRMLIVDLGDHLAMRPYPDEPIAALRGKYAGRGPTTDEIREQWRREDEEREARRR